MSDFDELQALVERIEILLPRLNDDQQITIRKDALIAYGAKREQAVQAAALKQCANFARKWNYMACSDVDGLVEGFLALDHPGQAILDEMLAELKAQTAAMLEKAAEEVKGTAGHSAIAVRKILALIPTDCAAAPHCIGYPDCDGDLVAEPHSPKCPMYRAAAGAPEDGNRESAKI